MNLLEVLKENYEMIGVYVSIFLNGILIIVSIFQAIKNKKTNNILNVSKIVCSIPDFIRESEMTLGPNKGPAKLAYVLNKVYSSCVSLNVLYDEETYKHIIENYLELPEKKYYKGDKDNEKTC